MKSMSWGNYGDMRMSFVSLTYFVLTTNFSSLLNLVGVEIFFTYSQRIQSMVSLKQTQVSHSPNHTHHSTLVILSWSSIFTIPSFSHVSTENYVVPSNIIINIQNSRTNAFSCFVFKSTIYWSSRFEVRKLQTLRNHGNGTNQRGSASIQPSHTGTESSNE